MEVKDFEKFLSIKDDYLKITKKFNKEYTSEEGITINNYFALKKELENFLFENQSNVEKTITKLKNSLDTYKYELIFLKRNEALNEVKVIKEVMELINRYDWQLRYSEYFTKEGKQVAVWEQNGDGQIRNHKVWNVK